MFSPELSSPNEYEKMLNSLNKINKENYLSLLAKQSKIVEPFSELAISKKVDVLTNADIKVETLTTSNIILRKTPNEFFRDRPRYEPLIFSTTNKIKTEDKVELSFIGFTISQALGYLPESGHVVLNDGIVKGVKLRESITKYIPIIKLLQGWLKTTPTLPAVYLNKHCPYCEFQKTCKEIAIKEDSLSLLGSISIKQIKNFEKKGIFTIKQLSYLYRPRKRGKRTRHEHVSHKYELQALALRTSNIYIQDKPLEIPTHDIEIFIDLECLPDENLYYLFGVLTQL
jgi:predicted RecB family nuclease